MRPLYLQTTGLTPTIIGEASATHPISPTKTRADKASFFVAYRFQVPAQNPRAFRRAFVASGGVDGVGFMRSAARSGVLVE